MLLRQADSVLVLVDVQERLAPAIADADQVIEKTVTLLKAARRLAVPCLVSEQYPKGLGPTIPPLERLLNEGERFEKVHFSALRADPFRTQVETIGRSQAVLAGMETHVCLLQTAMDFLGRGVETFVVADACGSRRERDKTAALARMTAQGINVVTSEMVLFEWLERAATPDFRDLLGLIR